jgi:hypothetical protein
MPPLRPNVAAWVIVIAIVVAAVSGAISSDAGNVAGIVVGLIAVWFGVTLWSARGATQAGDVTGTVAAWGDSARIWAVFLIVGGAVVAIANLILL